MRCMVPSLFKQLGTKPLYAYININGYMYICACVCVCDGVCMEGGGGEEVRR